MTTPDISEALRRLEESLYARLKAEIDSLRLDVNGRLDAIDVRLKKLETEYQMIVMGWGSRGSKTRS